MKVFRWLLAIIFLVVALFSLLLLTGGAEEAEITYIFGTFALVSFILFFILIPKKEKNQEINQDTEAIHQEKTRAKSQQESIQNIERIIKNDSDFNSSKIIHGLHRNAVALSPNGSIGLFSDELEDMVKYRISDFKSIKQIKPAKDSFGDYEDSFNCLLTFSNFENPNIKICLSYEKNEADELYDEINATLSFLKEKVQN